MISLSCAISIYALVACHVRVRPTFCFSERFYFVCVLVCSLIMFICVNRMHKGL